MTLKEKVLRCLNTEAPRYTSPAIAISEYPPPAQSEYEMDLGLWGFTYGIAYAIGRAEDPCEPVDDVISRALEAAKAAYKEYTGGGGEPLDEFGFHPRDDRVTVGGDA